MSEFCGHEAVLVSRDADRGCAISIRTTSAYTLVAYKVTEMLYALLL
jgi:hypothetical protein